MKKVTKGLLTTGVIALVIGACGDTVEVVTPETPPPHPSYFHQRRRHRRRHRRHRRLSTRRPRPSVASPRHR